MTTHADHPTDTVNESPRQSSHLPRRGRPDAGLGEGVGRRGADGEGRRREPGLGPQHPRRPVPGRPPSGGGMSPGEELQGRFLPPPMPSTRTPTKTTCRQPRSLSDSMRWSGSRRRWSPTCHDHPRRPSHRHRQRSPRQSSHLPRRGRPDAGLGEGVGRRGADGAGRRREARLGPRRPGDLYRAVGLVAEESAEQELRRLFRSANALDQNAYEDDMPAAMVAGGIDDVERFAAALESCLS